MPTFALGSISTGTMRQVDLIPTFADFLEEHGDNGDRAFLRANAEVVSIARETDNDVDFRVKLEEHVGDIEYGDWMLADLFDRLDALAPEGHRFGSHEGDGADYGFWEVSK